MRRRSVALSFACSLLAQAASGADVRPVQPVAAGTTRIMLFNLTPAGSYDVRRNGASHGVVVASPTGGVVYDAATTAGDRFEFVMDGLDPVTPARPQGVVAAGNSEGCVALRWTPPAPADYVSDYSLLWGRTAGAYTDSVRIDGVDIAKGVTWMAGHCGFPSGTYAFALRARNAFDRWSTLSAASIATIGNEDTQGPLPPTGVQVREASFGCASVTWTRSGDATVAGYRVFFGSRPRAQAAYTDSIDAGDAASANRCGLPEGNYYFAVRAYTSMGLVSAYSKEVLLSARGVDEQAPTVSQRTPAAGATGVARNATVYFVVTDDRTGVDASSITVTVNGVERSIVTSATTGGLAVQSAPAGDLPANSDIDVVVDVSDRADPANSATRTWTFRTGSSNVNDTEAPVIAAPSPAPGEEGVDTRPTIEVRIRDTGLGADLASLVMQVNGEDVEFTIEGTPGDARIRHRPAAAFPARSRVDVHVEACDAADQCAVLDYHFTVGAAVASVEGRGAIVPDGFWAGDPSRPMEIRNLPRDWTVRIFDTAGHTVRRHVNTVADATWTWNFENEMGVRVAPALYLVRVTDGGGTLQRSGRFLVQSRR
jgi:hypothetical protein